MELFQWSRKETVLRVEIVGKCKKKEKLKSYFILFLYINKLISLSCKNLSRAVNGGLW